MEDKVKKILQGYYKLYEITERQHDHIKEEDMDKLAETIEERAKLIAELDSFDLNDLIAKADDPATAESEFTKILNKLVAIEEKNDKLLAEKHQENLEGLGKIKQSKKREAEYGIKQEKARVIDSKG